MTKRQTKIRALNMIGNMHIWCSEFIGENSDLTIEDKELIIKEVDSICEQLRFRAYKLEIKSKNKK